MTALELGRPVYCQGCGQPNPTDRHDTAYDTGHWITTGPEGDDWRLCGPVIPDDDPEDAA